MLSYGWERMWIVHLELKPKKKKEVMLSYLAMLFQSTVISI